MAKGSYDLDEIRAKEGTTENVVAFFKAFNNCNAVWQPTKKQRDIIQKMTDQEFNTLIKMSGCGVAKICLSQAKYENVISSLPSS